MCTFSEYICYTSIQHMKCPIKVHYSPAHIRLRIRDFMDVARTSARVDSRIWFSDYVVISFVIQVRACSMAVPADRDSGTHTHSLWDIAITDDRRRISQFTWGHSYIGHTHNVYPHRLTHQTESSPRVICFLFIIMFPHICNKIAALFGRLTMSKRARAHLVYN